jgi:hypothetical protein
VTGAGERNFTMTNTSTLEIGDLRPFYIYECVVAAVTVGAGPSAMITTQLPQDSKTPSLPPSLLHTIPHPSLPGPEVAPVNFTATVLSGSIVLRWVEIPIEQRNGLLSGYVVIWAPSDGSRSEQELTLRPDLVSYELTRLPADTQYNISILAFTVAGRGPSAQAQVTLPPHGTLLYIAL